MSYGRPSRRIYTSTSKAGKISSSCPGDCPYIIQKDQCLCLTNPTEIWLARKKCYFYETRNYAK